MCMCSNWSFISGFTFVSLFAAETFLLVHFYKLFIEKKKEKLIYSF